MTPNLKMVKLLELYPFKQIMAKYDLRGRWCRSAVFLFNSSSAVLFQDLIQEDETDIFVYDRKKRVCTANMYGVADRIAGVNDAHLHGLTTLYMATIDFQGLSLVAQRKRESLAFSLALIDTFATTIFSESLASRFDELFSAPVQQATEEWENCMRI